MSDGTRLIEVTVELMDTFGGRTLDGRRLSYEWGDPTATIGDERGITREVYTPRVTVTDDGMVVVERETLEYIARMHSPDPDGGIRWPAGGGYGAIDPACQVCGTSDEYAVPWPCVTRQQADAALGRESEVPA